MPVDRILKCKLLSQVRKMQKRFVLFFAIFIFANSFVSAASPVLFFSDLISGPNIGGQSNKGAFVTIVGKNFGSTRGSSYVTIGNGQADNYPVWTDTKISFQLGANAQTGDVVVHTGEGNSKGLPFAVRSGKIYFISASGIDSNDGSIDHPWLTHVHAREVMTAGDTVYFRAGTYPSGDYGVIGYRPASAMGNLTHPIANLAYPGETVIFNVPSDRGVNLYPGGDYHDLVFGGFTIISTRPFNGNDIRNSRIVNLDIHDAAYYAAIGFGVTVAGATQNNIFVYGNKLYNTNPPGTEPAGYNLYQGIYFGGGDGAPNTLTENIDIEWNEIDTFGSRAIQIHNDEESPNTGNLFVNITIANNIIHNGKRDAIRLSGPVHSANVYNNIIYDCGLYEYGAIGVATIDPSPNINIYNNVIYTSSYDRWHTGYGLINVLGGSSNPGYIKLRNNILYSKSNSEYFYFESPLTNSVISASNNIYYGNGNGPTWDTNKVNGNPLFTDVTNHDFHLQASSPAIDAGIDVIPIVAKDFDGITRPQGTAFDIGAYESASSLPMHPADSNQNGKIEMTELIAFIGLWKSNQANLNDVLSALDRWLSGR